MAPVEERAEAEKRPRGARAVPFWPFPTKTVIVPHAGGIDLIEGFFVARNVSSRKSSGKKAQSGGRIEEAL